MFTIGALFDGIAAANSTADLLCIPPHATRDYLPDGAVITYGEMRADVARWRSRYQAAGYGHGHRLVLLLDNQPQYFRHFYALNGLGATIVPLSTEASLPDLAYQLEVTAPDAIVTLARHLHTARALAKSADLPIVIAEDETGELVAPSRPVPRGASPDGESEAAVLFSSGTSGRPKGCSVTNTYIVNSGASYARAIGMAGKHGYGGLRMLSSLPLHHMGGLCMVFTGVMLSAGCIVLPDRFSPRRVLADARWGSANAMHYLGVIAATMLAQPVAPDDRDHDLRLAIGAGVNDATAAAFEARFGIPCYEGWGMTETGRSLWNIAERAGTQHCIGKAADGLEVNVRDERDRPVRPGESGELCLRWGGAEGPRWGFFTRYCGDPDATEAAWRGGWLRTGDMVRLDEDGAMHFVDRQKNIIRRSGENIASAEVERVLLAHPGVAAVAVLAVPDEVREEEVAACIVAVPGSPMDAAAARALVEHCAAELSYYKVPGWVVFVSDLPRTATQKIAKNRIFDEADPRAHAGMIDLRELKRTLSGRGAMQAAT